MHPATTTTTTTTTGQSDHGRSGPLKPLSGRRLSNIEQYKQRAAQKRQERIQGGGLAKQSHGHHSSLQSKLGSTLQPLPPSNYNNPLAQRRLGGGSVGKPQQHPPLGPRTARHQHQHARGSGSLGRPEREREASFGREKEQKDPASITTATTTTTTTTATSISSSTNNTSGFGMPATAFKEQHAPVPQRTSHASAGETSTRLDRGETSSSSPSSSLFSSSSSRPLQLFQDVKDNKHTNITNTEQQLQAQGITPVYEPQRHKERGERQLEQNDRKFFIDLFLSDKRRFLMQPGHKKEYLACTIKREKGAMGMYPKYILQLGTFDDGQFLLSARKRKFSKSSNYLISLDKDDLARQSGNYFGKLRSNFVGTEFSIFDKGSKPQDDGAKSIQPNVRSELGAVSYQYNILGMRGPRKMTVVIPAVDSKNNRKTFTPDTQGNENIMDVYRNSNGHSKDIFVYQNKSPAWNEQLGAFCLNFNGRVTEASVKNFQLVESDDSDDVVCQFGKISEDEFTMDYKWPMSALQAFAICLTSFDGKLACE